MTKAPLRPTRRKSLARPADSLGAVTALRALAEACAIGVTAASSGAIPLARPAAGRAKPAATSSASATTPLRIAIPMRRG